MHQVLIWHYTLSNIKNILASIYEGGEAPTHDEWAIVLMLNALEGSHYDSICGQLVSQFQNARMTPSQAEVHNAIAFAGFEHKRRTAEQANFAKHQKDLSSKSRPKCTNPRCKQ